MPPAPDPASPRATAARAASEKVTPRAPALLSRSVIVGARSDWLRFWRRAERLRPRDERADEPPLLASSSSSLSSPFKSFAKSVRSGRITGRPRSAARGGALGSLSSNPLLGWDFFFPPPPPAFLKLTWSEISRPSSRSDAASDSQLGAAARVER